MEWTHSIDHQQPLTVGSERNYPLQTAAQSVAPFALAKVGPFLLAPGGCVRVFSPDLQDTRMQNIAVLACICRRNLIEKVSAGHFRQAMTDLMAGDMLESNLALFDRELQRN